MQPYPVSKWWNDSSKDKILKLKDAGFASNLPLAPVVCRERNIDVVIAFDVSEHSPEVAQELIKSFEWIHKKYGNDVRFPTADDIPKNENPIAIKPKRTSYEEKTPLPFCIRARKGGKEIGPYVLYIPIPSDYIEMSTYELYFYPDQRQKLQEAVKFQWEKAKAVLVKAVTKTREQDPNFKWNEDTKAFDTNQEEVNEGRKRGSDDEDRNSGSDGD